MKCCCHSLQCPFNLWPSALLEVSVRFLSNHGRENRSVLLGLVMLGEMWEPWTHPRSSLSSLSEKHSSKLNHQPHVKDTSGSGIVMECTLLPPMACHRLEIMAYFPVAKEKERDVTMLSTWREDYLLCTISFTFILPSNLKCACWPGQIPFKIFQPEMDYYIQQPQHWKLWRGKEAASLFPCFSPLSFFSSAAFWNSKRPCCIPQKPLTRDTCSHPVALSISFPACCTLKKPNQNMLLQN